MFLIPLFLALLQPALSILETEELDKLVVRWEKIDAQVSNSLVSEPIEVLSSRVEKVGLSGLQRQFNWSDSICSTYLSNFTSTCLLPNYLNLTLDAALKAGMESTVTTCCMLGFKMNLEGCFNWCVPPTAWTFTGYVRTLHLALCKLPENMLLCNGRAVTIEDTLGNATGAAGPVPEPAAEAEAPSPIRENGLPLVSTQAIRNTTALAPVSEAGGVSPSPGGPNGTANASGPACPLRSVVYTTLRSFCAVTTLNDVIALADSTARSCCSLTGAYLQPGCFDPCNTLPPPAEGIVSTWRAVCQLGPQPTCRNGVPAPASQLYPGLSPGGPGPSSLPGPTGTTIPPMLQQPVGGAASPGQAGSLQPRPPAAQPQPGFPASLQPQTAVPGSGAEPQQAWQSPQLAAGPGQLSQPQPAQPFPQGEQPAQPAQPGSLGGFGPGAGSVLQQPIAPGGAATQARPQPTGSGTGALNSALAGLRGVSGPVGGPLGLPSQPQQQAGTGTTAQPQPSLPQGQQLGSQGGSGSFLSAGGGGGVGLGQTQSQYPGQAQGMAQPGLGFSGFPLGGSSGVGPVATGQPTQSQPQQPLAQQPQPAPGGFNATSYDSFNPYLVGGRVMAGGEGS